MTNVQSTAPHARHQRAYSGDENAPFKKVRKAKHGHATCHKSPKRPSGLEGKSVVLKRPTHPLTAYNFFFKYTRSKLLQSNATTDNDAVAAFPSPREFFDTLNLPREDRTDKKKRLHNKTHGKITFQGLATKIAAQWRVLSPEENTIYLELAKQDKERYYRDKDHYFQQMEEENQMSKEIISMTQFTSEESRKIIYGPFSTCMFSPPQRYGDQNEILSGQRGCTECSYCDLSPQSIVPNKQVNEKIIQKPSQCKGEKELDWEPLPMNTLFHTDMHELLPILGTICMDLEPTLIKYVGSNSCLDTEEVKLLKACFSLK